MSREERNDSTEILEWFPSIHSAMNEPLCLLSRALELPWKYVEKDYERYVAEMTKWSDAPPMSRLEFAAMCADLLDPYLEPEPMARIVQDLP